MINLARSAIERWYRQALDAVEPGRVTARALEAIDPGEGRLIVLAIGKAAVPMAQAALDVLGDRIDHGVIVTKQGQLDSEVDGFIGLEAGHPIPDNGSLRAGEAVLEAVEGLGENDTVIALISGGGSAIVEHPVGDLSLMDLQVTTELLMYAGAGIHDLNAVRSALSAIKAGGLRRAIGDARCITLMLSDVLGNDPAVIASGPTVLHPVSLERARQVVSQYRLQDRVPERVRSWLHSDSSPADTPDTSRDVVKVIADNHVFVEAARAAVEADGFRAVTAWDAYDGDARELAHLMVRDIRNAEPGVDVIVGGGEATSTVRGDGKGGRNTETALVATTVLDDLPWAIASLASDGDDGNSGAAGAIAHVAIADNAEEARDALARSDSASYLAARDALIITGPTGTNVNDVYIAVRLAALEGDEP